MKIKYALFAAIIALLLMSCKDEKAYIRVTNKVSNVGLDKMSFKEISIGGSTLLPGETSHEQVVSKNMDDVKFPMSSPLKFYMISGEKRVLLWTKESYELKEDQHLNIVIDNNTEVVNPLTQGEAKSFLEMQEANQ